MEFHDLIIDHVSFIYDLYEVVYVERKNLVRELLCKRIFDIAKAIP